MMKKVRAIIIDDEDQARKNLKQLVEDFCTNVEIIGEADSAISAFQTISSQKPDALFLDINMPDLDGISFAKILREKDIKIPVVFVTAYDQYAIQAFKACALDYLLKPINLKELIRISDKLLETIQSKEVHPNSELALFLENMESPSKPQKIRLPWQGGFKVINTDDIIRIHSDNCYCEVITSGKKTTVTITIGELEEILSKSNFFRVHNRHIINLNYIESYSSSGGDHVVLTTRESIPVARRRVKEFKMAFSSISV